MKNIYSSAILIIGLVYLTIGITNSAFAQCPQIGPNSYELVADPLPPGDFYQPGTLVQWCVQIEEFDQSGSAWLHGITIQLPPGWDESTLTPLSVEGCNGASDDNWYWIEGPDFYNGLEWGPGWYYDSDGDGDPLAGGIVWGQFCPNGSFEFCFEVSTAQPGDPSIDEACAQANAGEGFASIDPIIFATGDNISGSWGGGCPGDNLEPDEDDPINIICCDANAGQSPPPLPICDGVTIDLFDELLGTPDVGGVWTNPNGTAHSGIFDPDTDPEGEYTYTVEGTDGCEVSVGVTLEFTNLGYIPPVVLCGLGNAAVIVDYLDTDANGGNPWPTPGTWYYPDGTQLPGQTIDTENDPSGTYTYEFFDNNNCFTTVQVYITTGQGLNPGTNNTIDVCSNSGPFALIDFLGGNPEEGGTWVWYSSDPNSTEYYFGFDSIDPDTAQPGLYTYGLFNPACNFFASAELIVNIEPFLDAGSGTAIILCEGDADVNLENFLINADFGGQFFDPDGDPISNILDPSTAEEGTYVYVHDNDPCFDQAAFQLSILPDDIFAGDDTSVTICESGSFIFLADVIPNYEGGGDYLDPSGASFNGNIFPNVFPSGEYLYILSGPCGSDTAVVDVTIINQANAGSDQVLTVCDNESPFDLDDLLSGSFDAGGDWLDPNGNPVTGQFNPLTALPGNYAYAVGTGSCADTATYTINIVPGPDPGISSAITVCSADPVVDLFLELGGNPTLGGTWDHPTYGTVPGGNFDPATMPSGVYTYEVTSGNCAPATSSVTVTLTTPPSAGTNASENFCPSDPAADLYSLLGGSPAVGGSWTGPPGWTGTTLFNPATDPAGNYVYEVGTGNCTNTATVTIGLNPLPNPGGDGAVTVCDNDGSFNLTTHLVGTFDTPGTWTNPLNATVPGGFVNPSTLVPGTYTYSVSNSCGTATSEVEVSVDEAIAVNNVTETCFPNGQFYTVEFEVSYGDFLTYEVNGLTGALAGNTPTYFISDPIPAGTSYSLTVSDANACNVVSLDNIGNVPQCGCGADVTASGGESFCGDDVAEIELTLTGQAPFTVYYNDGTNSFTEGPINSNTHTLSIPITASTTFTIDSVADVNCTSIISGQSADFVVSTPLFAGNDASLTLCDTDAPVDLETLISTGPNPFTPNGVWVDPDGNVTDNIFDPQTDAPGDYFYLHDAQDPCPDNFSTVSVDFYEEVSLVSFDETCLPSADAYSVEITLSGGDVGSYQELTGITGSFSGNVFTIPNVSVGTAFTAEFSDGNGCNVLSVTNAGNIPQCDCAADVTLSGSGSFCEQGDAELEFSFSGQPPYSVTYTDGTNTFTAGPFASATGSEFVTITANTTFTLVDVTDANCTSTVNGQAIFTVNQLSDAGSDETLTLCTSDAPVALATGGTPQSGGTWTDPSGNAHSGVLDPATDLAGVYTYTVAGAGTCPDASAEVLVSYFSEVSIVNVTESCLPSADFYTVEVEISGGDPNSYSQTGATGGTFDAGNPNVFISDPIPTGTAYNLAFTDGNACATATASNTVNCDCDATANLSGSTSICEGEDADLTVSLNGLPPFDVVYSDGSNTFGPVTFTGTTGSISVSPTATTTYSLVSVTDGNCTGNTSGTATVTVNEPVTAGNDVSLEFCPDGGAEDLENYLDAGVDAGNWTDPSGGSFNGIFVPGTSTEGNYTYSVPASGACPGDDATVSVSLLEPAEILDVVVNCSSDNSEYTLSIQFSNTFDPASIISGVTGTLSASAPYVFTTDPIPSGSTYDFSVTDPNGCLVGEESDAVFCVCDATASLAGTTSICQGQTAVLTFSLDGIAPFDVAYSDGTTTSSFTTSNNTFTVNVSPSSTTTYTLVSVEDALCQGNTSGSATVTVNPLLQVSDAEIECDDTNELYTVSFTLSSGVPSGYEVTGGDGDLVNGVFTSDPIPSGQTYSFTVTDGTGCNDQVVEGFNQCACTSFAGTLDSAPLVICEGDLATVTEITEPVLDGNDTQFYVLHTGSGTTLGDVIATSLSPSFGYQDGMLFNTTYYISSVVGNSTGLTFDDQDPCLSVSTGTPVQFTPTGVATITGGGEACEGDAVPVEFNFDGVGPITYAYQINGDEQPEATTNSQVVTLDVSDNGSFIWVGATDGNGCAMDTEGFAVVEINELPTATLIGEPIVCPGSGDGPTITLTGDAPWDVTYSINGATFNETVTNSSGLLSIEAEEAGDYTVTAVSDALCEGTASGSVNITIPELPSGSIEGGGVICDGDSAEFTVNLSGEAPYNFSYTIDNFVQPSVTTADSVYTFSSGTEGMYALYLVADEFCQNLVQSEGVMLNVNEIASGTLSSSVQAVCPGDEVVVTFNLVGEAPFEVSYTIDGTPVNLSNISSGYSITLTPQEATTISLLQVRDDSEAQCYFEELNETLYIGINSLPQAPVLYDFTMCSGDTVEYFTTEAISGYDFSWSPTVGLTDPKSPNTSIALVNNGTQMDTITYTLTTKQGNCKAESSMDVIVDPGPSPYFTFEPEKPTLDDPTVYFTNQTAGSNVVFQSWSFDSLGFSSEWNPEYTFPNDRENRYEVSLEMMNVNGCSGFYRTFIDIRQEMKIFVPSAFTPDGDSRNDLFFPVVSQVDLENYEFTVYNRWGEMVFQTRDPDVKWNGTMRGSDYLVQGGVYVWTLNAKDAESNKKIEMKGSVTVIR